MKDTDPEGYNGAIYGKSNNHNIDIQNCTFTQSKASTNSSFAMIYMRDANNITISNCDLSGKSQGIHFRSNNSTSHLDVHHISVVNNNFHDIIDGVLGRAIRFSSQYYAME